MKMKWILFFSLFVVGVQAYAENAVVIDAQSIGEPVAASAAVAAPAVTPQDSQADANAANKERILKGGKLSNRERVAVARAELAGTNKQAGDSFLANHKILPGVTTLPSGVQYKVLRGGKGQTPAENSVVKCRYKGTLIDGTQVDTSGGKRTATMIVSGFLPGLKEAVKLMTTGSKWEIVIPPELAYGSQGNRGVGPNAVIIYEMEILGIK